MQIPLTARIYLAAMVAIAAGCLVCWLGRFANGAPAELSLLLAFALLTGLAIVAQHFPLPIAPHNKTDLSMAVYFAALSLFGGALAVGLVAISQLLGQGSLALRRNPVNGIPRGTPRSVAFNVSQLVIAMAVAGLAAPLPVFGGAPMGWEHPGHLLLAALILYILNTFAVATMIGLQRGQSPLACWWASQKVDAVEFGGLFVVGLATALATARYPWAPLVMALPAIALYLSLRRSMELLERERTARLQAEAATAEARSLHAEIESDWAPQAAVLDGLSDGVIVFDADRRVTYCNPRAARIFGLDREAIPRLRADSIIAAAAPGLGDPESAEATWNALLSRPREFSQGEIGLVGMPPRTVQISVFPVADHSGERLGLVLRDVSDTKVRAILEERARIAMDLHDGTIQSLYSAVLSLRARERALRDSTRRVRSASRVDFDEDIARLNGVIQDVRNYIFNLRKQTYQPNVLAACLRAISRELEANSGVQVDLDIGHLGDVDIAPEVVANLTHIAREATANVVRHARASRIQICLSQATEALVLTIADDGKGFAAGDITLGSGHGLLNMAERARSLRGQFNVDSAPGRGVTIRVAIPVAEVAVQVTEKEARNDEATVAGKASPGRRSPSRATGAARPVSDRAGD